MVKYFCDRCRKEIQPGERCDVKVYRTHDNVCRVERMICVRCAEVLFSWLVGQA